MAPHLLGGIYAWASAALALGATLTLALVLWETRHLGRLGDEPIVALFGAVVLVTGLHALPVPASVAAWLSPAAYAHAVEAAQGLARAAPRWLPWSQDPAGTWERLLFAVGVFATYCSARILTVRARATPLLAIVALSVVGVALSHLGHRMVAAERVYGVYSPKYYPTADGPILNANNLAGLLALGLPVCLGFMFRRAGAQRWAWLAAAGTICATGLLAGSRAGLVVLVAGPVLFGFAFWGLRRPKRERRGSKDGGESSQRRHASALSVASFVSALLALAFGLADLAADDFLDTDYQDLSKLEMFRTQLDVLFAEPRGALLGVGRGAFRTALAPVVRNPIRMMYAECLPLQYAIEFGIPLTLLFLGPMIWLLCRAVLQWRSPVQLGGAVGVVAIGLQNLLDFSLELSGIAVPACVCFAACLPSPTRTVRGRWELVRWGRIGLAASAISVVAVSYPASVHDIRIVQERLASSTQARDTSLFWEQFEDTVRFHPVDASVSALAAYEKVLELAPDAPFWLNRTMRMTPSLGTPHIWAAHWLILHGRWSQAEDELRLAAELQPRALLDVLCTWLQARPSAEFAASVVPRSGIARRDILNQAAECLSAHSPIETAQVDGTLLIQFPDHPAARVRSARRSLAAGDPQAAINDAQRARKAAPRLTDAFEVEATALVSLGRARQAAALLESALGRADAPRRILFALATAQAHAGNAVAMRDAIDRLRVNAGARPQTLAEVVAHQSACERILGNDARALAAMLEAHRTWNAPSYQAAAANIAYELGQTDFVLRAWTELCEAKYNGHAYCDARDKLRKKHELDGLENRQ